MTRDSGRRRARQGAGAREVSRGLRQLPWGVPASPYQPLEVLSADQVEAVSDTAFRIL